VNNAARIGAAAIVITCAAVYATSSPPEAETSPIAAEMPGVGVDVMLLDQYPRPLDLYGNEVTTAIARYKLDASGVMYEEHSPDTELPRLGIPRS
jgi:hypothetical protein